MKLSINKSNLTGKISVPGSKSHTIRAVAVAMMADGISKIYNPLISEDAESCLKAAELLGAKVKIEENLWTITGINGKLKNPNEIIDLGNSGTSLRILAGLAATADFAITFDGDESLRSRPMHQLLDALENLGVEINSNNGKCPVTIKGPIKGGKTKVDGTSSQFLTSLLFSTPLAKEDSIITVDNLNEKPYAEITLDWLKKQNIKFDYNNDLSEFKVKANQKYNPYESTIPADFSTATFPLIASAVTKSKIEIQNLDFSDKQGDKEVFKYLEKMGLEISIGEKSTIVNYTKPLKGVEIDLNATPDALPAMAVVACFAKGETKLYNVTQARIKETDRIKCMTCELRKMGADIEELEDGMIIKESKLHSAELKGYDDHRIVMALAIAGMGMNEEITINGAEAASVTYPNFIKDFKILGANLEEG